MNIYDYMKIGSTISVG